MDCSFVFVDEKVLSDSSRLPDRGKSFSAYGIVPGRALFHIAIAQDVAQVPADAAQDYLGGKVAPFEQG
jgi:hypothetical protein